MSTAALPVHKALVHADLDDEFVNALHRGDCTPEEIADRLYALSGRPVLPGDVTDWLYANGYDACTAVHGRAMCERPARPGSNPPRCTDCDRSTR